jgi:imidazoleglycerol-phosphate dehydratase/histidinol-phosphatase
MKKVLFIDRDGTLIKEPPVDYQVDALEKLEFMPGVFRNLYKLRHYTDFELVVVSNQDGLGTAAFPEEDFLAPHNKFLEAFRNEGVEFDAIFIDPSLPEENSPRRKPRTGMLKDYLEGDYDLGASYVIGDRLTDMELARNLGSGGILLGTAGLEDSGVACNNWDQVYSYIRRQLRRAEVIRKTSETEIHLKLSLDGEGSTKISTGLGFFDHMLDQLGRHGGMDLEIQVVGDLDVDEHHTIEDTAIALGEAFDRALGSKRGIERYAFVLPMDDSLATVALDLGGRPWIRWNAEFKREKIGDMPTEMFFHFFKSFSDAARCNLSLEVNGLNEHHMIEGLFKAFAKALGRAAKLDPDSNRLPSTKGLL